MSPSATGNASLGRGQDWSPLIWGVFDLDPLRTAPRGESLELAPDRLRQSFSTGCVRLLVEGEDVELPALVVDRQVGAGNEPVAVEDREHEVAPLALRLGRVDLEPVREAEQLLGTRTVAEQVVERAQDRRSRAERLVETFDVLGADPPVVAEAVDGDALHHALLGELGEHA